MAKKRNVPLSLEQLRVLKMLADLPLYLEDQLSSYFWRVMPGRTLKFSLISARPRADTISRLLKEGLLEAFNYGGSDQDIFITEKGRAAALDHPLQWAVGDQILYRPKPDAEPRQGMIVDIANHYHNHWYVISDLNSSLTRKVRPEEVLDAT